MAIAVADVNQDGRMDLITSISDTGLASGTQSVFLNTASSAEPFASSEALQPSGNLGRGCLDIAVGDVNGDARPDLLFSCSAPGWNANPAPENPAVGSIYLHSGATNPFANTSPVDSPATSLSGYGRGVDVGTLVANAAPVVLVVDGASNYGAYYPTVLAQDPIAQNDSVVVAINTGLQIDVLANDTAASGQTLDVSSLKITETPQHGTATVNASGSVTYAAASGYAGLDVFAYTVRDSLGARSQRAVVNIAVQPAPVATNDLRTLAAGQSVTLDVLANDTSSGTLEAASITIAVQPLHGTAVVTNGQVVYAPAAGYAGVDAFQYCVTDNLGSVSNVATVSLSVQPAPIATNDASSVQANQSVTINVLTNDRSEGGHAGQRIDHDRQWPRTWNRRRLQRIGDLCTDCRLFRFRQLPIFRARQLGYDIERRYGLGSSDRVALWRWRRRRRWCDRCGGACAARVPRCRQPSQGPITPVLPLKSKVSRCRPGGSSRQIRRSSVARPPAPPVAERRRAISCFLSADLP